MSLPAALTSSPMHRRVHTRGVPLLVFEHLYTDDRYAFFYESLEAHGAQGRFSFLGGDPALVFKSTGDRITLESADGVATRTGDPIQMLRDLVNAYPQIPRIATFSGGAVGYLSYDMIRFFERLPADNPNVLGHPESCFLFPNEVIIFDHQENEVHIILFAGEERNARADEIERAIAGSESHVEPDTNTSNDKVKSPPDVDLESLSNTSRDRFEQRVLRAKEYICAGDIYQVVLSQRFSYPVGTSPIDIYKSLRRTNPSPYMYFLKLDELQIAGSSPEVLVKLTGSRVYTRPLAGTRPRGATQADDDALASALQADEKERAEHVMLVDLARNDIGRVCEFGSVRVLDKLQIERFSKVMHLVSSVEGTIRADRDAFDLVAASFPAGTVSGAPKIRAMEIIEELEPDRRGIYAGAIGYFSATGDMDLCIAIRTIVLDGNGVYVQAGAGIVADSEPSREYEETLNKAAGLMDAIDRAAT